MTTTPHDPTQPGTSEPILSGTADTPQGGALETALGGALDPTQNGASNPSPTEPALPDWVWWVSCLIGLVIGGLNLTQGDEQWWKIVRACASGVPILAASYFVLSNKEERELIERWTPPIALIGAWIVAFAAIAATY